MLHLQQPPLITATHIHKHTHTYQNRRPVSGGTCQLFCTLLDPRCIGGVIGITTILRTTQFSIPSRAALNQQGKEEGSVTRWWRRWGRVRDRGRKMGGREEQKAKDYMMEDKKGWRGGEEEGEEEEEVEAGAPWQHAAAEAVWEWVLSEWHSLSYPPLWGNNPLNPACSFR